MQKVLLFLAGFFLSNYVWAQSPDPVSGFQWKRLIGSGKAERFSKIIAAPDGYLLIGSKEIDYPNEPDTVEQLTDVWVVKITSEGYIEWQKTYGGSGTDVGITGIATSDNGFLILGTSESVANDGDVSGHHGNQPTQPLSTGRPQNAVDAWVLKIDASGNIEWTKTYGGMRDDRLVSFLPVSSNEYVLTGNSYSRDGDLTGIRRGQIDPPSGLGYDNDVWVLKIDGMGNILWQRCYGGNESDEAADIAFDNSNNSLVIVGTTFSTDLDLEGLPPLGRSNGWLFGINNVGDIQLNKMYGGSSYESFLHVQTYDSKYYVVGVTGSDDGDVEGYHPSPIGRFHFDIRLLEIDRGGVLQQQLCIGTGESMDIVAEFSIDPASGISMIGSFDGTYFFDQYDFDFGLVKRSTVLQELHSFAPLTQNNYLLAGAHVPQNHGLVNGYSGGYSDGLLVRYGPINAIKGNVYFDQNGNHAWDTGEPGLHNIKVISQKPASVVTSFTNEGAYLNPVDTGTYTTTVSHGNPYYTVLPASHNSEITNYFSKDSIDFALTPIQSINDLVVSYWPVTPVRPGFDAAYQLKVYNVGTAVLDTALVKLVKSSHFTLVSADKPHTLSNDTIFWKLGEIKPFDSITINLKGKIAQPPVVNNGDTLKSRVVVLPITDDQHAANNADTLYQLVVGSYDPNDKTEKHGGVITPEQLAGNAALTYTIRFQNTGTDTAFNVTIMDTLSIKLNWNNFEMIAASHPYQLTIDDQNKCTWIFNNIKLVDSNRNEPLSHGFIVYQIKPLQTLQVGDIVPNTAAIYFDYNLPVPTNTNNTIVMNLSTLPVELTSFTGSLSGSTVKLKWTTSMENQVSRFEVLRSANGTDFISIGTVAAQNLAHGSSYSFIDRSPLQGYNHYRLSTVDLDGSGKQSGIVLINVNGGDDIISTVAPNPTAGNVTLKLQGPLQGAVVLSIFDYAGRKVYSQSFGRQNTTQSTIDLPTRNLVKGAYILQLTVNGKMYNHKLIVQ